MCWTSNISYCTQSHIQHAIFVNVIDCVVGAVVEQVYSGAVGLTRSRDNKGIFRPTRLLLPQSAPKCGGPTWGGYSAPQLHSWNKGEGRRKKEGEYGGRKGKGPPMSEIG